MNKIDNPFTPGAGFLPPELAGRERVIEDGRVVAARTRLLRAERGLMLIGSGLPTLRGLVAKSKTYAERMFGYEEIGALDVQASADAIRKPLEKMGVEIEDKALKAIYKLSGGYPFFLQECGYQLWQAAEKSPVTVKDVKLVIPGVTKRLDRNFFAVRLDRVSELERRFLLVMADVPGNEAKPLSAIAKGLGRSVNSLSMLRRSLIRKGVLYSSAEGTVSYTVPLFGEYLKRHSPMS